MGSSLIFLRVFNEKNYKRKICRTNRLDFVNKIIYYILKDIFVKPVTKYQFKIGENQMNNDLKPKEYEIMKFIWAHAEHGVTFGEIHDYADGLGKPLSRQRVNCYIQAMIDKGFVTAAGEDRRRIYTPAMPKEEYDHMVANDVLEQLFDGSLKNFICALNGGEILSDEKEKELSKILRNARRKK